MDSTVHPRLYRRGARYYHRAAIPQDIKDTYPKSEETFSLGTSDYQEAVRRVRVAAAEVDRRFAEHRQRLALQAKPLDSLSEEQIEHLASRYYATVLEGDETMRERLAAGSEQDPYAHAEVMAELLEAARTSYATGSVAKHVHMAAFDLLEQEGLQLSPGSSSWQRLKRLLQEAFIRAGEATQARDDGKIVPTPKTSDELPASAQASPQGPLVSAVVKEWISEKSRSWSPKTAEGYRVTLDHFLSVVGDRPLSTYSKADGRAFKSVLLRLPANWSKKPELRGLSMAKAADRAEELGMAPMSDKNVNKLLEFVGAFWNWASEHYDDAPANPIAGLKVKLKKAARQDRDPFTLEELQAIFRAPVFTGCKSVLHWRQPGSLVPRDSAMFWTPLVSLFTGARMNEVLQLYVEDVKTEDGITYLDINGDGEDKSLKTASSWRLIPIHPELVRLGFLQYVERMRKRRSLRLFPDIAKGVDGYYSTTYSKRFRQLLDSIGVKHSKNAFHSFRHNFEDACRDSDISAELMNALQGHAESGMANRYGRGYMLPKLAEAINRLQYRGLDLGHLYP